MLKSLLATVFAAALAVSMSSSSVARACDGDDHAKKEEAPKKKAPAQVKTANASFHVEGMHCAGCADKVKTALNKTEGVFEVDVKVADARVAVKYDQAKLTPEKIAKIITDAGYKATPEA